MVSAVVSVVLLLGIFVNGAKIHVTKKEKQAFATLGMSLLVYFLFAGKNRELFLYFYAVPFILSILYFSSMKDPVRYWIALKQIVVFFAVLSLFFYVGGTVLGIIPPTRIATFEWSYTRTCRSFFDLYFEAQHLKTGAGFIQRNTGIFTEAPMYSFVLTLALGVELFLEQHRRKLTCFILVATMLTTLSTTGYLSAILLFVLLYAQKTLKSNRLTVKKIILLMAGLAGVMVALSVIENKGSTESGTASMSVRMDHLLSCLRAFCHSPLVGVGFSNQDAVLRFSEYEQGMSVGLPYLMATGGIVLTMTLLLPFALHLKKAFKDRKFGRVFFEAAVIFAYFFTAVTSATILIVFNGFLYISAASAKRADKTKGTVPTQRLRGGRWSIKILP